MTAMSKRLSLGDRRAIDVLLDRVPATSARGNGAAGDNQSYSMQVTAEAHIRAAEKILGLLDHLPAEEPAADLVDRTMKRINGGASTPSRGQQPRPDRPPQQPHA
jgi:hypothetical protein